MLVVHDIFSLPNTSLKFQASQGRFFLKTPVENFLLPYYCNDIQIIWKIMQIYEKGMRSPEVNVVDLYFLLIGELTHLPATQRAVMPFVDDVEPMALEYSVLKEKVLGIVARNDNCLDPFTFVRAGLLVSDQDTLKYGQASSASRRKFTSFLEQEKKMIDSIERSFEVNRHMLEMSYYRFVRTDASLMKLSLQDQILMSYCIGAVQNLMDVLQTPTTFQQESSRNQAINQEIRRWSLVLPRYKVRFHEYLDRAPGFYLGGWIVMLVCCWGQPERFRRLTHQFFSS